MIMQYWFFQPDLGLLRAAWKCTWLGKIIRIALILKAQNFSPFVADSHSCLPSLNPLFIPLVCEKSVYFLLS